MKTFTQFLNEDDAGPTNVSGPAVANKDVPMFIASRWAGKPEIKIPHKNYLQIYKGKERGAKWGVDDPHVKKAIQGALYKEGQVLVTSDMTGASALLRHKQIQRLKADQDFTLSESQVSVYSVNKILNEDETDGILDIDWQDDDGDLDDKGAQGDLYTPAHDYAQFQLGYNEQQAEFFADVVTRVAHLWDRNDSVQTLETAVALVIDALEAQETAGLEIPLAFVQRSVIQYIGVKDLLFKQ